MTRPVSTTENQRWGRGCLLAGLLLAACGGSPPSTTAATTVAAVTVPATTAIPATATYFDPDSLIPTKPPRLATVYPSSYATAYAMQTVRAIVRLTPRPSNTPQPTPLPITATPQLGLLTDCGYGVHGDPYPANCWQLFINGILYQVTAGRFATDNGTESDQGVLWVRSDGQHTQEVPWYHTPQQVGSIHIVTIEGLRVTVANRSPPNPPASFVFDLATRQWLHPDGTPWPTPTPLPTMPP